MNPAWIEANKQSRPFAAGALAAALGLAPYYGCHYGLKSEAQWCRDQFIRGWNTATYDMERTTP